MQKDFDVAVFGATGVTGAEVARCLVRTAPATFRVALAGRHANKLQAVLDSCTDSNGASVQVLAGIDATDPTSIHSMVSRSRLVLACVGPFRLYGEPLFRTCAEQGTDYLDICGEPEFIERMELSYFDRARSSGCLMASACGFDSIPGDLGALYVQRQFAPPAVPSSVAAVISIAATAKEGACIHYPTWESAVFGLSNVDSLRKLRAEAKAAARQSSCKPAGPRPRLAAGIEFDQRLKAFTLPFPGADAAVVRRTQAALAAAGELPVHFTARFAVSSRFYAYVAVAVGGLMSLLCKSAWGRGLLLKHAGAFSYGLVSKQGPSREQVLGTTARIDLLGRGYSSSTMAADPGVKPDLQVAACVTMPEPGYAATSIILVDVALTLLEQRQQLLQLVGGGGVFTAGALFRNSSLIQRLNSHGVVFQTLP